MRDDRMKWAALPETFLPVTRDRVAVTSCDVGRQYLVSGISAVAHGNASGWPDVVTNRAYRLQISRDQSLHVGGDAQPAGWQADVSLAVSDMSDGYHVFQVSGPAAFDLLCRGAELDLQMLSHSVARQLWGMHVLLYRHTSDSTYRLHVERGFAMALFTALARAADQVALAD